MKLKIKIEGGDFLNLTSQLLNTFNAEQWRDHPPNSVMIDKMDWQDGIGTISFRKGTPFLRLINAKESFWSTFTEETEDYVKSITGERIRLYSSMDFSVLDQYEKIDDNA